MLEGAAAGGIVGIAVQEYPNCMASSRRKAVPRQKFMPTDNFQPKASEKKCQLIFHKTLSVSMRKHRKKRIYFPVSTSQFSAGKFYGRGTGTRMDTMDGMDKNGLLNGQWTRTAGDIFCACPFVHQKRPFCRLNRLFIVFILRYVFSRR